MNLWQTPRAHSIASINVSVPLFPGDVSEVAWSVGCVLDKTVSRTQDSEIPGCGRYHCSSGLSFWTPIYCFLDASNWMAIIFPEPDLSNWKLCSVLYYFHFYYPIFLFRNSTLWICFRLVVESSAQSLIRYSINAGILS